jgi:hypothetical protein
MILKENPFIPPILNKIRITYNSFVLNRNLMTFQFPYIRYIDDCQNLILFLENNHHLNYLKEINDNH